MTDETPLPPKVPPQGAPLGPADIRSSLAAPAIVHTGSLDSDPLNRDFKNFLWRTWMDLFGGPPSALQYDMADWLQHGGGNKRDILMGFRGAAKSYITVDYDLWRLRRNRDEQILTVSATSGGAGLNSQFAFKLLDGFDWLADLRPRNDQRRSTLAFDVNGAREAKSESFAAESIFGQITGRRASLIVADDIETPQTSETESKRSQLAHRFGELGGAVLIPGGEIKVLGTAQTEQTIYLRMVNDQGYSMRMYPLLYPEPKDLSKFGSMLAPLIGNALRDNPELADTSTEPGRFDEADIAQRFKEFGRTEFERQMKLWLDAGLSTSTPLKMRDLLVLDWGPPTPRDPLKLPPSMTWQPVNEVPGLEVDSLNGDSKVYFPADVSPADQWMPPDWVRCKVDPSGGGSDETTWSIGAHLSGRVFLCAQGADLRGHSKPVLDAIAADCKLWGVSQVTVEGNFGQDMFASLLQPCFAEINHPVTILSENSGQQAKEVRIVNALEPVVTSHRLVVNRRVLMRDYLVDYPDVEQAKRRFYRFTYQFTRMTKAKGCVVHDDRVEGVAELATMAGTLLRQQTAEAERANKEKQMANEVQKMIAARKAQGLPTFGYHDTAGKRLGMGPGRGTLVRPPRSGR